MHLNGVSNEGSGETACLHRIILAFAARIFDVQKYMYHELAKAIPYTSPF